MSSSNTRHEGDEQPVLAVDDLRNLAPSEMERLVLELQVHRMQLQSQRDELASAIEELSRMKASYQNLYDFAPVAFFTLDTAGCVLECNRVFCQLLGEGDDELLGSALADYLSPEHRDALHETLHAAMRDGGRHVRELVLGGRVEAPLWVELRCEASREGLTRCVRCCMADISPRKTAELGLLTAKQEAEGAMKARSEFLAMMSHEIRTPLHAVLGTAELLEGTSLDDEQRGFLQGLRSSGDSLLHIINDILDFSRIEASSMELRSEAFDLGACVEAAVGSVAVLAATKGLDLSVQIDPTTPSSVRGDPHRLRQILVNLVGNAVKFTDDGFVETRLEVLTGALLTSVVIEVEDSGSGIPADRLETLFDPFTRVEGARTTQLAGTGLGLAITKQLVSLMGGRVSVQSIAGEGSLFRVELTLPVAEAAELPRTPLRGRTYLVVDQFERSAVSLVRQLRTLGARVHTVRDARSALTWLERPLDGVFLDVHLADPQVHRLASRLRTRGIQTLAMRWPGRDPVVDLAGIRHKVLARPLRRDALQEVVSFRVQARSQNVLSAEMASEHPLRVLVVEDNPLSRRVLTTMLCRLGYAPDEAIDGHHAIAAVEAASYDLILMDMQMPGLDGVETSTEIRRRGYGSRIVAVTANASRRDERRCRKAGMNGFVRKPFRAVDLVETLRSTPRLVEAEAWELAQAV